MSKSLRGFHESETDPLGRRKVRELAAEPVCWICEYSPPAVA